MGWPLPEDTLCCLHFLHKGDLLVNHFVLAFSPRYYGIDIRIFLLVANFGTQEDPSVYRLLSIAIIKSFQPWAKLLIPPLLFSLVCCKLGKLLITDTNFPICFSTMFTNLKHCEVLSAICVNIITRKHLLIISFWETSLDNISTGKHLSIT